jgi:hypothetical protein
LHAIASLSCLRVIWQHAYRIWLLAFPVWQL